MQSQDVAPKGSLEPVVTARNRDARSTLLSVSPGSSPQPKKDICSLPSLQTGDLSWGYPVCRLPRAPCRTDHRRAPPELDQAGELMYSFMNTLHRWSAPLVPDSSLIRSILS